MEETFINWLKQPSIVRSLYIISCMVISFALGVTAQFMISHRGDNPVIEIPQKPLPLAYHYKSDTSHNPMDTVPATEISTLTTQENPPSVQQNQNFVASKTGKNYYPNGCAGINRIKVENRVYFETSQEAERKGYILSESCK